MNKAPLTAMGFYPQWMLFKTVWNDEKKKNDKFPLNPHTFKVSDPHDPALWVSMDKAYEILNANPDKADGVTFSFTEDDPFFFLDIDNAHDGNDWSDTAKHFRTLFDGAAIEVSQSGKGLHIFGMYTDIAPHGCTCKSLGLELYHTVRFVAITGKEITGNSAIDCTGVLNQVIKDYFPGGTKSADVAWSSEPVGEWSGPEDDEELIRRAMASSSASSAFQGKPSFADLFTNQDHDKLLAWYGSESEIDGALAQHLAFWTGKNHTRMWNIMWKSGLIRPKWHPETGHPDYLQRTICNSVAECDDVYAGKSDEEPVESNSINTNFIKPEQFKEFFEGHYYISDIHRVFIPNGRILKPDQYKTYYAGNVFNMDAHGERSTRNAFEAFTESQLHDQKVDASCFLPLEGEKRIIHREGITLFNTYIPLSTTRRPGNIDRFHRHMEKMFKKEIEREIVYSYMAAIVQYPGIKFQWCPLIQGTEGNGKSMIARVLDHSVGQRYTHWPNAADLAAGGFKFNSWLYNKLLIIIEEIFCSDKREITEPLKVCISNGRLEVQFKGADQFMADNVANFILFTNHKDALLVDINARRYCILYTDQQSNVDILADGMGGDYFPSMYEWLSKEYGYEMINEFLHNYTIATEFNPAGGCQRAPLTSSTGEAISLSLNNAEAVIEDAIKEGRTGFRAPYISSYMINEVLKENNARLAKNKYADTLAKFGYEPHPGLNDHRISKNILPEDGRKPIIYILRNSDKKAINDPNFIFKDYMETQGYPYADDTGTVVTNIR